MSTRWRRLLERLLRPFRSRRGRLVLGASAGIVTLASAGLAAREFAATPWPLSHGHPGLLAAAGARSSFSAPASRRAAGGNSFAADERPRNRVTYVGAAVEFATRQGMRGRLEITDVVAREPRAADPGLARARTVRLPTQSSGALGVDVWEGEGGALG